MGSLLARFRKKQSTIDILEGIEKDITKLQKFRLQNQERQKKFIGRLILYSILMYILSAIVFYFYYLPNDWKRRILYSSPLLVFPILIWFLKKILHWYFVKRITKNDFALNELRKKRSQILEDVMEKETYKKAREILQKFDPAKFKELETPSQSKTPESPPGSTLRQRTNIPSGKISPGIRTQPFSPRPSGPTSPRMTTPIVPRQGSARMQPRMLQTPQHNGRTPRPPLPRPVLPRERSKTDRLLEYLLGDGPQNRYALICKYCHSHNGMAMKEEFEYISFRCCYCYQMNQAKKYRPYAPKLETTPAKTPASSNGQKKSGSTEEMDEEDENDDDDDNNTSDGDVESSDASGTENAPGHDSNTNIKESDTTTNVQLKTMTNSGQSNTKETNSGKINSAEVPSGQTNSDKMNSGEKISSQSNDKMNPDSDQQVSSSTEAAES